MTIAIAHSLRLPRGGTALRSLKFVLAIALIACAASARAAGFFGADQDVVRADVEYLTDAGVLRLPVSTWPLPIDELHRAVAAASEREWPASLNASLRRLEVTLDRYDTPDDDAVIAEGSVHPTPFRFNEPLPRENGELGLELGRDHGRFTFHIAAFAATQPDRRDIPVDRNIARLDGTYGSLQLGNWLFAAGYMPRSWGPSRIDSLILSTNARPVPALSLDRVFSTAPSWRWLRWIGEWRVSAFVGQEENDRDDVKRPLLGGARIVVQPFRTLELGVSRTAQFCGRGRRCNVTTLKDLVLGHTNTNTSAGITPETDPGNDLAGFDVRWHSTVAGLPYAIYAQMIGEDQQGGVPFKYLGEFGLNIAKGFANGSLLNANLEYDNTACSFTRPDPIYYCAYHHYIFNRDGYRYRGNVIGSMWQGDAEVWSLALRWVPSQHTEWRAHLRHGRLNRSNEFVDVYNIPAPTRRDLDGGDVEFLAAVSRSDDIRVGAGLDRFKDPTVHTSTTTPRLYLTWRHRL